MLIENNKVNMAAMSEYRNVLTWRPLVDIIISYLGAFILLLCVAWQSSWVLAVVLSPVVGAFQNRLTVLLHDGVHRSLNSNRNINDWISQWLVAFPIGNFFNINVVMHRNHHNEFGKKRDPNVMAYTKSHRSFLFGDLPRALFMLNIVSAVLNFNQKISNIFRYSEKELAVDDPERNLKKEALKKDYIGLFLVQGALASFFYLIGYWWLYLYWVVCRVTWCTAYNSIRLFVEHHSDVSDEEPILANTADQTKSERRWIDCLERFFIAPLNFNLHGTHHLAPFIPYHQLEKLTEDFRKEGGDKMLISRRSYILYALGYESTKDQELELKEGFKK